MELGRGLNGKKIKVVQTKVRQVSMTHMTVHMLGVTRQECPLCKEQDESPH